MTHYEIPTSPSPQVEAVLNYLDSIKVFDVPKLEKLFTDDFVQSTRPLSLETSSRTKADDLAFLQGFADQLRDKALEITIYDIIESPGKAWAHVLLYGEPKEGRPFNIECIYQFTFAGDSATPRFKAISDFLDSKAYAAMMG